MPQSLDQVYLHTIFSTKDRYPFFDTPELQRELHAYLAGVSNQLKCPAIKIGGVSDHVHLLTRLPRTITIADFVKETKRFSSLWLHERSREWSVFHWQAGYGVFSVSASNVEQVEKYISGQNEHHRTQSFQDEYREFLRRHEVDFDERYVWD
ncbi:MAG: IS200/IS605 family transposase [Verrucomicrobiales bacterium]|nr:IS200/IS605 family transposase [Verrucomicrobiales bacterium]